jgi:predicted RNA binding protein YcfA (HicA-like mRNA interferase family)
MSRTPRVAGAELIAALAKAGFKVLRVRAAILSSVTKTGGVRSHSGETIGIGLLHKILRDCRLTADGQGYANRNAWSRAGDDRRARRGKTAVQVGPVCGLRLWPSILSVNASALEPRPCETRLAIRWSLSHRDR